MQRLVLLALVGLAAQLIDGALGMGFGVTSASLLLAIGFVPASASATVHMAEVVTTLASGAAHWRLGNSDRRVTLALALPGSVGAFGGAVFLASIPADLARPFISIFLFGLGVAILVRFHQQSVRRIIPRKPRFRRRFLLVPLGLVAGFCDASGGGGWGPITTSTLLARRELTPRKVVGSVDTSESAVAFAATLGFLLTLGWEGVNLTWVAAFMIGGIIAAPIAAWLVTRIPPYLLGILVAGVILLTNSRTLMDALDITGQAAMLGYLVILAVWGMSLATVIRERRRRIDPETVPIHRT